MTGAIDVRSFSLGVENAVTIGTATGGAGTGKAQFNEVTIEKNVDATTPFFFQRLATGANLPAMELVARRTGTGAPYLRYCFTTVFVSGQKQASGDDGAVDPTPRSPLPAAARTRARGRAVVQSLSTSGCRTTVCSTTWNRTERHDSQARSTARP
jgi:type VI secretion system (T6SS) effector Hcp